MTFFCKITAGVSRSLWNHFIRLAFQYFQAAETPIRIDKIPFLILAARPVLELAGYVGNLQQNRHSYILEPRFEHLYIPVKNVLERAQQFRYPMW